MGASQGTGCSSPLCELPFPARQTPECRRVLANFGQLDKTVPVTIPTNYLLLVAFILCGPAFAAPDRKSPEWSQFRGPNGEGVSQAKGVPITWNATQHIAWKTPLPGPGASSPVVLGNRIYATCYSGYAVP